jgi:DNA invertase Pin-like site-specific DNA recombinase
MNQFFGYVRVSTAKQGEQGVSLQQQRDAIARYGQRNGLEIIRWFQEQETAAKRGRPIFSEMMRLLRKRRVEGVVIHKIDRSARNLRDWADLGELIDGGVDVRFANESLDLSSRGGRLSADIQAVVAADYIRNLREETKKGFYGRLKQGILPMPAPIGYLDAGAGKAKTFDPVRGPLIRAAFELYATARFNHHSLAAELFRMGLRTKSGKAVTAKRLSYILNNTFYMGLITIKKTNETYAGSHEPLITRQVFGRVQDVMHGRTNARPVKHDFLFRRRVACKACGYSLVGETHKSYVYYRCQVPNCHRTCVREEVIETAVLDALVPLRLSSLERAYLKQELTRLASDNHTQREQLENSLRLRLNHIGERLDRLTDACIDRLIDRDAYEQKKKALLLERIGVEDNLKAVRDGKAESLIEFLERADTAYYTYKTATLEQKRKLLEVVTSNRTVDGKTPEITLRLPFSEVANRLQSTNGGPLRAIPRTWQPLLERLMTAFQVLPLSATTSPK